MRYEITIANERGINFSSCLTLKGWRIILTKGSSKYAKNIDRTMRNKRKLSSYSSISTKAVNNKTISEIEITRMIELAGGVDGSRKTRRAVFLILRMSLFLRDFLSATSISLSACYCGEIIQEIYLF
jgi:hypothetical protein